MKILCLALSLPTEINSETLTSIAQQTVKINHILICTEQASAPTFPSRVSIILNNALEGVNLEAYDYLLRVDMDTVLPLDFIEENLKENPDCMGFGYAQLIKIKPFKQLMNGRFHPDQDDSYIRFLFLYHGLKSTDYKIKPLVKRPAGKMHSYHYFLDRGGTQYRFGYEPIHILSQIFLNTRNVFAIIGYLKAALEGKPKYCFAQYTRGIQTRKFTDFKRLKEVAHLYTGAFIKQFQLIRKGGE